MGMTFSHLLPGLTGFAATVVMQWYSADPGLIRIAIVLFLGFLLLGVAIMVFRRSIKEKGKQVPKQTPSAESQMLETLEQAIEEGQTSLDLDVAASPITHEETPSPLADLAQQFDNVPPQPETEHVQIPQIASNGANHDGIAHPPPNPARPETAHVETACVSLPRLSELRGMRFSQALRELDRAKRTASPKGGPLSFNDPLSDAVTGALAGSHNDATSSAFNDTLNDPINEILMSAIAPFEPMFAPTASAPVAQNGANATNQNGAQGRPSLQTFFPPKPALPERRRSRREDDGGRSPRDPKAPGTETDGFLDQLHILPSRRGQYKKKG
jgi:hypothetical protein